MPINPDDVRTEVHESSRYESDFVAGRWVVIARVIGHEKRSPLGGAYASGVTVEPEDIARLGIAAAIALARRQAVAALVCNPVARRELEQMPMEQLRRGDVTAPSTTIRPKCHECGIRSLYDGGTEENRHPPEWIEITKRSYDPVLGWLSLSWYLCLACWTEAIKNLKHARF